MLALISHTLSFLRVVAVFLGQTSDERRFLILFSVYGAAFGCFMGRSKRVHVLIVINIFLEEIAKEINRHAGACEP